MLASEHIPPVIHLGSVERAALDAELEGLRNRMAEVEWGFCWACCGAAGLFTQGCARMEHAFHRDEEMCKRPCCLRHSVGT